MLPMVDLEVIGSKKTAKLKALLDTGFAGYVCIPTTIAQELGLELSGVVETELANGQWVKTWFSMAKSSSSAPRNM